MAVAVRSAQCWVWVGPRVLYSSSWLLAPDSPGSWCCALCVGVGGFVVYLVGMGMGVLGCGKLDLWDLGVSVECECCEDYDCGNLN